MAAATARSARPDRPRPRRRRRRDPAAAACGARPGGPAALVLGSRCRPRRQAAGGGRGARGTLPRRAGRGERRRRARRGRGEPGGVRGVGHATRAHRPRPPVRALGVRARRALALPRRRVRHGPGRALRRRSGRPDRAVSDLRTCIRSLRRRQLGRALARPAAAVLAPARGAQHTASAAHRERARRGRADRELLQGAEHPRLANGRHARALPIPGRGGRRRSRPPSSR